MRAGIVLLLLVGMLHADGPVDNVPDKVRQVPPPGIPVPAEIRASLQKRCDDLAGIIADLRVALKDKPALLALLPDVQIFHKAVHDALAYDEFYAVAEFKQADALLQQGLERAAQLRAGKPEWTTRTGLLVRGYVSKIDGSVQPYGLVVPASYKPDLAVRHRLDFWCHGRGEKLTELAFIQSRLTNPGEFTPAHAFVLHLYGRYCCANKFAGEVDLFEAYDSVRRHYPIDDNRLVIRGFSMGGAACWQFAVHYPDWWAAAAPGAGFSETPDFLKVFQDEKLDPTPYEKKLWRLYDCTDYALNLFNCPTVAYSGEIDKQKQAADIMAKALDAEQMTLTHLIGPKTGHSYHPATKAELNRRIDAIVAKGRNPLPSQVRFTSATLRYNRIYWVQLDGLEKHWELARVAAEITGPSQVDVKVSGVTALTLSMPSGLCPLDLGKRPRVRVNDQVVDCPPVETDRSWTVHLRRVKQNWVVVDSAETEGLAKRHGVQGPIDDAFWDRFLMVRPTGEAYHKKTAEWAKGEMDRAVIHWRRQFRGDAPVKDDKDVSDADIAASNLILWGDPSSNKVLARIAAKLPIRWDAQGITVNGAAHDASHHAVAMIYPNPLNPKKYVVLNSGFTFRDYDYLNNARQVPKLPDYAVFDLNTPPNSRFAGKVVRADFFDEGWGVGK